MENVQDLTSINDEEFRMIKSELKDRITNYLELAGFNIDGYIDLEFDMIGDDRVETWR